ncbi:nam-like protein 4, partial [Genlisea aurea]
SCRMMTKTLPLLCKRERSEEDCREEPLCFGKTKRSKQDDPSPSQANGSEESTTTSQDHHPTMIMTTTTTKFSSTLNNNSNSTPPANQLTTFDSSNLEKSVPPGYLKFISNLENEILNATMERETLRIEVMRAQAMINVLQSRIELLSKENDDLRR